MSLVALLSVSIGTQLHAMKEVANEEYMQASQDKNNIAVVNVSTSAPENTCETVITVKQTGALIKMRDQQIRKGLCNASKALAEAMAEEHINRKSRCKQATSIMMEAFKRRFPDENPKNVTGDC